MSAITQDMQAADELLFERFGIRPFRATDVRKELGRDVEELTLQLAKERKLEIIGDDHRGLRYQRREGVERCQCGRPNPYPNGAVYRCAFCR